MKKLTIACFIASMLLTTVAVKAQTTSPSTPTDKAAAAKAKADKKAAEAKAKADKQAADAKAKADKQTADAKANAKKQSVDAKANADKQSADARAKADKQTADAKAKADKQAADAKAKASATSKTVSQGVNKSADKAVGTDAKGRTIYEGPRGGRYTLTAAGNKEYIKKN